VDLLGPKADRERKVVFRDADLKRVVHASTSRPTGIEVRVARPSLLREARR
jgi:hypothetical protein